MINGKIVSIMHDELVVQINYATNITAKRLSKYKDKHCKAVFYDVDTHANTAVNGKVLSWYECMHDYNYDIPEDKTVMVLYNFNPYLEALARSSKTFIYIMPAEIAHNPDRKARYLDNLPVFIQNTIIDMYNENKNYSTGRRWFIFYLALLATLVVAVPLIVFLNVYESAILYIFTSLILNATLFFGGSACFSLFSSFTDVIKQPEATLDIYSLDPKHITPKMDILINAYSFITTGKPYNKQRNNEVKAKKASVVKDKKCTIELNTFNNQIEQLKDLKLPSIYKEYIDNTLNLVNFISKQKYFLDNGTILQRLTNYLRRIHDVLALENNLSTFDNSKLDLSSLNIDNIRMQIIGTIKNINKQIVTEIENYGLYVKLDAESTINAIKAVSEY